MPANEPTPVPHMPARDEGAGRDADDALSAVAARNLQAAMSLRQTAWELTAAGLRAFRPALSEAEVQREVRAQFRRSTG